MAQPFLFLFAVAFLHWRCIRCSGGSKAIGNRDEPQVLFSCGIAVFAALLILPVFNADYLSRNACILRLRLSGLFPYFISRQA